MATREAVCHCGQLRLDVEGDPFVVGMCHCLACQRRTGSAFGMQAGFAPEQVQVFGLYHTYRRISDEEDRRPHDFRFCAQCGSNVFYTEPDEPDLIVVSVGSFADPPSHRPRSRATTRVGIGGWRYRRRSNGRTASRWTRA